MVEVEKKTKLCLKFSSYNILNPLVDKDLLVQAFNLEGSK